MPLEGYFYTAANMNSNSYDNALAETVTKQR